ncbi:MAG: hypothetical protein A2176_10165 [Spirochaetes bacterium RBG_13_51_14]|nr:MAG: hypothetical protein A2176_10165 [Spirochaetes bacterium RBG_13_51_14]
MVKKMVFGLLSILFLFTAGCKKEGVSLVNAGLRDIPSNLKYKWVITVNRGQVVKILEEQTDGDWMKVLMPDGETEGWIMKSYIHKGKKRAIVFTDSAPLYEQPDVDSKVRFTITTGTKALVLRQKDLWYNVSITWGREGWVKSGRFKEGIDVKSESRNEVVITGIGTCFVEASSSLPEGGGYTYTAMNLFDKNTGSTWQAGNGGVGEWVEISFPEPVSVRVSMINGFVKVDPAFSKDGAGGDLYQLNNRVKSLKVEIWDGQDRRQNATVNFGDQIRDYQDAGIYHNAARIRFTIDRVYKGLKWNDTALAEIRISKE